MDDGWIFIWYSISLKLRNGWSEIAQEQSAHDQSILSHRYILLCKHIVDLKKGSDHKCCKTYKLDYLSGYVHLKTNLSLLGIKPTPSAGCFSIVYTETKDK